MTSFESPNNDHHEVIPKLRLGILGCADIAKKICAAIKVSSNIQLVAIASRSFSKVQQFVHDNQLDTFSSSSSSPPGAGAGAGALEPGEERQDDSSSVPPGSTASSSYPLRLYDNYQILLNDPDVQAVYIPLPTLFHLEWVTKAAQAGKHILIEKPVAVNSLEFIEMLQVCQRHGVFLMDGTMFVHHPRTQLLRQTLRDPSSGPLHRVQTCLTFPADENFFQNNIRTKVDADPLGAIGDLGRVPPPLLLSL
jgi:predicted dehydrogenase